MDVVEHCLGRIDPGFWNDFLNLSTTNSNRLNNKEWWHNKMYCHNEPNHGIAEQTLLDSPHNDIPWFRDFFYPSADGRFSLRDVPVVYFSEDFLTTCCEVVEGLRNNDNLKFVDIDKYLEGDTLFEGYGYPLSVRIEKGVVVADLTTPGSPLFSELSKLGMLGSAAEFFNSTIRSRDPKPPLVTQGISRVLREKGFDGVLYKSVRTPLDVVIPDRNVVLFSPKFVIRDPWDPENPKGFLCQGKT